MKYSERAQSVITFARQEAARLSHEHISTGHLLLGMIREGEGTAITFLKNASVELEEMRAELENLMESTGRGAVIGQLKFTSRASNALKIAAEEGKNLGHEYIGTEHLLMGLIDEREGVASRELLKRGIDMDKARSVAQAVAVEEGERSETLTFHNVEMTIPMPQPDAGSPTMDSRNEVLDLEQASELLGITVQDMSELLKNEDLPGRVINGQWRFSRDALIRWLGDGISRNYANH